MQPLLELGWAAAELKLLEGASPKVESEAAVQFLRNIALGCDCDFAYMQLVSPMRGWGEGGLEAAYLFPQVPLPTLRPSQMW